MSTPAAPMSSTINARLNLVPKIPPADKGQKKQQHDDDRGNDDRADDLAGAGEIFQKLKQKQVIPFGPGGGVLLGRIGRSAQSAPR